MKKVVEQNKNKNNTFLFLFKGIICNKCSKCIVIKVVALQFVNIFG